MKITPIGREKIEDEIRGLTTELKKLREEKLVAYSLTGDTWHDNPYFNELERNEEVLTKKITEAREILEHAEIVSITTRNMETIQLGSIVKCVCTYPQFQKVSVYEIVGDGEADIARGKLHYQSPVVKNILGLRVNEEVSFDTPGGKATYKILKFYQDWESVEKECED